MSDNKLDNLLAPSWLSSFQQVQKQFESINQLTHQASVASQMHKQIEVLSKPLMLENINLSEWYKPVRQHLGATYPSGLAIEKLGVFNQVYEASNKLHQSVTQESLHNQSSILKSIAEQSKWMKSIDSFNEIRQQVFKSIEHIENNSLLIESLISSSNFAHLNAFESIANLCNTPLNRLTDLIDDTDDEDLYTESIQELDKEINVKLTEINDFEKLSLIDQNKIIFYLKNIFLPLIISLLASYIYDQIKHLAHTSKSMTTSSQVKRFARNESSQYNKEILKNLRMVTGNNVNLRTKASIKSEIILQLNTGTLIEVLDKSNRAWLLVEISDGDDVIQGWIARRYTAYFK